MKAKMALLSGLLAIFMLVGYPLMASAKMVYPQLPTAKLASSPARFPIYAVGWTIDGQFVYHGTFTFIVDKTTGCHLLTARPNEKGLYTLISRVPHWCPAK